MNVAQYADLTEVRSSAGRFLFTRSRKPSIDPGTKHQARPELQ